MRIVITLSPQEEKIMTVLAKKKGLSKAAVVRLLLNERAEKELIDEDFEKYLDVETED